MPDVNGKSAGYIGRNTKLYRSTAGDAGPWTEVYEVRTCDPSEPSVDTADLTHLTSPNRRREPRSTYIDDGTVAVTCNAINKLVDPTGAAVQEAIYADQGEHDANNYWKIEAIDDSAVVHRTFIFPGDVQSAKFGPFDGGAPVDFAFTILRTGATVLS